MLIVSHNHGISCNHCRGNMHLIDSSADISTVFTGPSASFRCREDFCKERNALQLQKKTRAYPSLRDSTCLNPKCSSHSSSIPCPLFLRAAPGVLATPHLLSQMEREALKVRPLEEESCRPIWLSVDQKTTQTERDVEAETSRVLALSHS